MPLFLQKTFSFESSLLLASLLFCSGSLILPSFGDGNEIPGGVAGLAGQTVERRQARVKSAQTLFASGSQAYADKSYGEAMDYFKAALETMPEVPAVYSQRLAFFDRYQTASLRFAEVKVTEARWTEAEQTLEAVYSQAEMGSIDRNRIDPRVKRMLDDLKSKDDLYNMATTPRHLQFVDEVESQLILGKGYLELGDYDRAERAYNEALKFDPYNSAARRGLESVERYRLNYYDAAYDHTRAKRLAEVTAGWETPIASFGIESDSAILESEVAVGGSPAIERKLKTIRIPQIEVSDARLVDVLDLLRQKSQELDVTETNPAQRGVNFLVDSSGAIGGQDLSQSPVSFSLTNIPLGEALRYAVESVGMKYRVDNFAVTIVPASVDTSAVLLTKNYIVPPGFISSDGKAGATDGGGNDPFAVPEDNGGTLLKRITAQAFLEQYGVTFQNGALARYIPATSTLVVRNTASQHESINNLILSAKESGDKMVKVAIKLISIEQSTLQASGMDFLLGAFNVGSTPRVFAGGGTNGNSVTPVVGADFPFVNPGGGPVGLNPVSNGLRMADLSAGQTIDGLINQDNIAAGGSKIPGILSLSGVFTDPQFQMVLRALSQLKGSDLMTNSHVVVRPGQTAKIEQIREFIYPTEYDPPEIPNEISNSVDLGDVILIGPSSGVFPATPATPTAFETRSLGQVVEVEPTVSGDNKTVSVNVAIDFSDFTGFINYGTPILNGNFTGPDGQPSVVTENRIVMPVFDSIRETTNVTVWDGQTIAIGGFHGESVTDTEDKVPFIGDLPVIGKAFRSSIESRNKRAIVIFVTVNLIDPGGNPINLPPRDPDLITRQDVAPPVSAPTTFAPGPIPYQK